MNRSVAFAGLGRMGQPMAANLLRAGFPLTVWNRSAEKADDLVARGARRAATLRELAAVNDVVLTSLADPVAVEETYVGADGLLAGAHANGIFVDLSTVSPALSQRLARAAADRGARLLDAPVAGSVTAAAAGTVAVMVGGAREAYDACADIFAAIGRVSYYLGESGSGSTMKLVSNAILATIVQALAEGLALGEKGGLAAAEMLEVIGASSAAAPVIQAKASAIADRAYLPAAFTLRLMQKDLSLCLSLANELIVPMPATALAHAMVLAANAAGRSDHDFAAVARLMEDLAGLP